jgi:hypothetical protein
MSIIYNILSGTSSNYNSVWADSAANIASGRFYTATTGSGAALSVVDLSRSVVVDSYTMERKGGGNEFLENEDIVDINVSTAGS